MSGTNLMPVPIVQMGLVEKLAVAEQTQPYLQQLAAQESAREALKAQNDKVPDVDSSEHGKKIRHRDAGHKKKEQQQMSERSGQDGDAPKERKDNSPSRANPWAGQLLSVKV